MKLTRTCLSKCQVSGVQERSIRLVRESQSVIGRSQSSKLLPAVRIAELLSERTTLFCAGLPPPNAQICRDHPVECEPRGKTASNLGERVIKFGGFEQASAFAVIARPFGPLLEICGGAGKAGRGGRAHYAACFSIRNPQRKPFLAPLV